jgi:LCP family protein required for cell wall assembly
MAYDPWAETQPNRNMNDLSPDYRQPASPPVWMRPRRRRIGCGCGCSPFLGGLILAIVLVFLGYALTPARTNLLILGIDYAPPGSAVSRSDTIILATIIPTEPYVATLSIPRDLWVNVTGVGENRINTAHFFAEAQQPGSGPYATMETIRQNFDVDVTYFLRLHFETVRSLVNAMGGVDIDLDKPMAGYQAGKYHLTGNKALAFARHRLGADDFFRMEQGQLLIRAILKQMLRPKTWPRIPFMFAVLTNEVDTNLPWWQWPRLAIAILRAGPDGIDHRTIERQMTTAYTTDQGASVLLPDWSRINPLIKEIFGQ